MIENFLRIRRDGRRLAEAMDALSILALGWGPDQIVRIEWEADGARHARDFAHGVLAKVSPDKSAIVLLEEVVASGIQASSLSVINADGSTRYEIANTHRVDGALMTGNFVWFEAARVDPDHAIGLVFQAHSVAGSEQVQFDLNLVTGEVVKARMTR